MGLGGADGIADGIPDIYVDAAVVTDIDGDVIAAVAVLGDGDVAGAEVEPRIEGRCAVTVSHVGARFDPHIIYKAPRLATDEGPSSKGGYVFPMGTWHHLPFRLR